MKYLIAFSFLFLSHTLSAQRSFYSPFTEFLDSQDIERIERNIYFSNDTITIISNIGQGKDIQKIIIKETIENTEPVNQKTYIGTSLDSKNLFSFTLQNEKPEFILVEQLNTITQEIHVLRFLIDEI